MGGELGMVCAEACQEGGKGLVDAPSWEVSVLGSRQHAMLCQGFCKPPGKDGVYEPGEDGSY